MRIDYKTIEISKILCYNICACQAAYLGKGGLYHPAMKPPDIDKRTDSELIRWVDEALREKSGYTLPPKIHIAQQDGDYYNVMPCIYERGNIAMVKMIGRHSIKRGEDRSSMMGDILLYESDTGILRALMDGEYITTLRTGISAAHSARLFTRPDFETVGLIGLGNIMTVCIRAFIASLRAEGDRRDVTLKLIRYHDHQQRIMDLFREDPNVHFVLCDTYEEVIGGSDLVFAANIYDRAAVPDTPYRYCREKYFI